jgi:hypothetical protein
MLSEIYGKEFLDRSNLLSYFKEIASNRGRPSNLSIDKDSINYDENYVIIDKPLVGKLFTPKIFSFGSIRGLGIEAIGLVPNNQSVFGRNLGTAYK